jgi:hypothetical protein
MVDVFASAVQAIYGECEQHRREADAWLAAFKLSPAAWEVATKVILQSTLPEAVFIAADIIVRKTRSEWRRLSETVTQLACTAVRCVALHLTLLKCVEMWNCVIMYNVKISKPVTLYVLPCRTRLHSQRDGDPSHMAARLSMALAAMICRSGSTAVTSEVEACVQRVSPGAEFLLHNSWTPRQLLSCHLTVHTEAFSRISRLL